MRKGTCPFCERLGSDKVLLESPLSAVFYDIFPVSPGHCLVVPKRHVESLFDMMAEERADLFALLPSAKNLIDERFKPSGMNLGMNIGQSAGQTVFHAHLHIIPRYAGDVEDPRGGVRQIIPAQANYWKNAYE